MKQSVSTSGLVKAAIVTSLYVVLTLLVAPVAYGPIQFRISEILNYLGLYHRRYIYAVTLGVFIANFQQYGPVDMIVGSLTSLFSILVGRWLGQQIVNGLKKRGYKQLNEALIQYVTLAIVFAIGSFPLAVMLVILGAEASFWPVYGSFALSELIVMVLGIPIMMTLSKRIDFDQ